MVGRWAFEKDGSKTLVAEGLIEKCVQALQAFISKEEDTIDKITVGRRTPRNPIIMEVLRDYGYVPD